MDWPASIGIASWLLTLAGAYVFRDRFIGRPASHFKQTGTNFIERKDS